MHRIDTDLLILGAGLAGLRAALSAHEASPDLRIAIVSLRRGPSGSSFANRNGCLGMQVCRNDADVAELTRDALELGRPGLIHPELATCLAAESLPRFEDLLRLGLSFRQNPDKSWQRHSACFSPESRRAVICDDLPGAYACFRAHLDASQVTWLTQLQVLSLVQETSGAAVGGAVLRHADSRALLAVRARVTVMALGGPAPLFRHHLAGPGNPGYAYALLHHAGARLANLAYLQIMWSEAESGTFFPLQLLADPDATIGPNRRPLPEELRHLALERGAHCPYGYGLPDRLVDRFLADNLLSDESMAIHAAGRDLHIRPMVHAGNGGALIDPDGRTNVPRLYACGECATGMHGANRIGGGMILATQVFGHRAGRHAAQECAGEASMTQKTFTQLTKNMYDPSRALTSTTSPILGAAWRMAGPDTRPKKDFHCFAVPQRLSGHSPEQHQRATVGLIVSHFESLTE